MHIHLAALLAFCVFVCWSVNMFPCLYSVDTLGTMLYNQTTKFTDQQTDRQKDKRAARQAEHCQEN